MRYILLIDGEWVKNPDGSVYQYEELEISLVIRNLLQKGDIETVSVYKYDGVPNSGRVKP